MNWTPGRTDFNFAEINHFYIYWTSQGDLQFNQHSFIVIFRGLKLVPKYCLLNMEYWLQYHPLSLALIISESLQSYYYIHPSIILINLQYY